MLRTLSSHLFKYPLQPCQNLTYLRKMSTQQYLPFIQKVEALAGPNSGFNGANEEEGKIIEKAVGEAEGMVGDLEVSLVFV